MNLCIRIKRCLLPQANSQSRREVEDEERQNRSLAREKELAAVERSQSANLLLFYRASDTSAYEFDEQNLWNASQYYTRFPRATDGNKRFPVLWSQRKTNMKGQDLCEKGGKMIGQVWSKGALSRVHTFYLNWNKLRDTGCVYE